MFYSDKDLKSSLLIMLSRGVFYFILFTYLDVNECEVGNGGCSQICVDTFDGYCCMCRPGYELIPLTTFSCLG